MGFRNLSKKHRVISAERGVALFTAMMLLVLVTGLLLFILQSATTEMQIANETRKAFSYTYKAESGIEQALAWLNDPTKSPDAHFFSNPQCEKELKKPDRIFAVSIEDIGATGVFRFYNTPNTPEQLGPCTVEVTASSGKAITVDLAPNPMPEMAYAIDGLEPPFPDVVRFGSVHAKAVDLQLETRMNDIRRFAKRFGRYFIMSSRGTLEENGIDVGTFDMVFANKKEGNEKPVFIDFLKGYSRSAPLKIGHGPYKGYFYFFGDIEIEGGGSGQSISINDHQKINEIDLSGFFYTQGRMIVDGKFWVYGALYAGLGFQGDGLSQLQVWYNINYSNNSSRIYKGVLPLIPKYHPSGAK